QGDPCLSGARESLAHCLIRRTAQVDAFDQQDHDKEHRYDRRNIREGRGDRAKEHDEQHDQCGRHCPLIDKPARIHPVTNKHPDFTLIAWHSVAFIASRHALLGDAVLLTTLLALFLLVLLPLFFRHGLLQLLAVLCHLRRRHSAWITLYTTSDFLLITLRSRPPFGRGIAFRVIFLG